MSRQCQYRLQTLLWLLTWSAIATALWASSGWLRNDVPVLARHSLTTGLPRALAVSVLGFLLWRIIVTLQRIRDMDL